VPTVVHGAGAGAGTTDVANTCGMLKAKTLSIKTGNKPTDKIFFMFIFFIYLSLRRNEVYYPRHVGRLNRAGAQSCINPKDFLLFSNRYETH
jgi:hypothetical protein